MHTFSKSSLLILLLSMLALFIPSGFTPTASAGGGAVIVPQVQSIVTGGGSTLIVWDNGEITPQPGEFTYDDLAAMWENTPMAAALADPSHRLVADWVDADGIHWVVETIISTNDKKHEVEKKIDDHEVLVKRLKDKHPPKPAGP